jgi:hypothetical protein
MNRSPLIALGFFTFLGMLSCKKTSNASQSMSAEEAKGISSELDRNLNEAITNYGKDITSSEYQNTIAMMQTEQDTNANNEQIATISNEEPLALKSSPTKKTSKPIKLNSGLSLLEQTNMINALWAKVQAAWDGAGRNACRVLEPQIRAGGTMATRPYFFAGGNVEAGVTFIICSLLHLPIKLPARC